MNFKEFYNTISDREKIEFLTKLLVENTDLQRNFMESVKIPLTIENSSKIINYEEFIIQIKANCIELNEIFQNIDISEVDWDNYQGDSHYREDWEIMQEFAEDQINTALEPSKDYLLNCIIENNILELLIYVSALYDVCTSIELDDPNESLGDMQEDTWIAAFETIVNYVIEKLEKIPDSRFDYSNVILLYFRHIKNYENKIDYAKNTEKLILQILRKTINQKEIFDKSNELKAERDLSPEIFSYLINKFASENEWLDFAMKNYNKDQGVSESLLKYLHQKDDKKFSDIAYSLLNANSNWCTFLADYADENKHRELYKTVFLNLTKKNSSIEKYKKVQKYLNENEKNTFFETIWRNSFKVELLVLEGKTQDAKKIVQNEKSLYDFKDTIKPLYLEDPDFCFAFTRTFLLRSVENERGRSNYEQIANILKATLEIPKYLSQAKNLITEIFNYNKRLSALRSELENAGLV